MEVLIVLVIVWVVFGFLGRFIAEQKGRDAGEGFALGLIFGPLGCLIEALLPNVASEPGKDRETITRPSPLATEAAIEAVMQRQREALEREAEASAERRREWWRATSRAWSTRRRAALEWFWRHDLAQAVAFGLALAIPAGIVAVVIASRR